MKMKHMNNSLVTTPQIAPALNGLHRCPCTGKGDAQEASVFWNEAPQLILFLCEWTGCQGDAPALLSPVLAGTWSFSKTLVQCYRVCLWTPQPPEPRDERSLSLYTIQQPAFCCSNRKRTKRGRKSNTNKPIGPNKSAPFICREITLHALRRNETIVWACVRKCYITFYHI